ncbi:hypothetical protein ONZ43_g4533 [Nemania bipapillata]|uniref:Uncharacterized protein n=1 Tax=Nemania bipapillata TaxID=110536 RepID=A0ACC2ILK9_9PEZI|nr:hypothetical protein ONZ43_g4533 [Nemania bipapillata]
MVVFDGHPDVVPPDSPLQCTPSNLRLCRKLRPWQFANLSSVDMSVQQFMLEGGTLPSYQQSSIERVSRLSGNKGRHAGHESRGFTLAGSHISHYGCRARIGGPGPSCPQAGADDLHEALRLEPMINVTDRRETSGAMLEGFAARTEGRQPDFKLDAFEKQGRWGMQFAEFWPDLQTLELVLETYAMKEKQLDSVVKCAKLWVFPLHDGRQLEWNGKEEARVRWRGASEYGYDAELGMSWPSESSAALGEETPAIQWRPTTNDTQSGPAQEFVMKSLVFTRRRSVDATGI